MSRIGIYSGSFDPIHKGHIAFGLSALNDAQLDKVYFIVESLPRHKPGITHMAHRNAMVRLALRAHPNLEVLELPDKRFSVASTLPRLQKKFKNDELYMLVGSDVLQTIPKWPLAKELLSHVGLIVGIRDDIQLNQVLAVITSLPRPIRGPYIIDSAEPTISSKQIRHSFRQGHTSKSVLPSVSKYIKQHWLYASVSES